LNAALKAERDESVLIDEGRQAGKHRLVAVALQLHALIKQRRHLNAALKAERDESVLIDEGRQAGKHRLVAVALQLHALIKQR
jgi:RNase adaptor protein for sRNA GlmZ degradation